MPHPYSEDFVERLRDDLAETCDLLQRAMNVLVNDPSPKAVVLYKDIAVFFAGIPEKNGEEFDDHPEE